MSPMRLIYVLNLVNMAAIAIAQVMIVPILIHYLGIHNYEKWLFFSATASIGVLASLGTELYATNRARMAYAANDPADAQLMIGQTTTVLGSVTTVFAVIATVMTLMNPSYEQAAFGVMLISAPLSLYRSFLSYVLTARTSQIGELVNFIAFSLLQAGGVVVACWLGGGLLLIAIAWVGAIVVFGALPLIVVLKIRAPEIHLRPMRMSIAGVVDLVRHALPTFSYKAAEVSVIHLPIVLLTTLPGIPAGSAATFAVSRTLVGIVRQFGLQLARSNGIELSRLLAPENAEKLRALFLTGSAITAMLAATGLFGLLPVADLVIADWTHKPSLYDPIVVLLFCIGGVLSAQVQLPMILPQFTNRAELVLRSLITQVLLIVTLGSAGAMLFHARGMVAALSIAELTTMGVVSLRTIIPSIGLSSLRFVTVTSTPMVGMIVLSASASWLARTLVNPRDFAHLVLCGAIWAIIVLPIAAGTFIWMRRVRRRQLSKMA